MNITTSNILIFVALLGGVAHIMIFQNGLWNDAMWMTAMMSVGIPFVLHRYLKKYPSKNRRRTEKYAEI